MSVSFTVFYEKEQKYCEHTGWARLQQCRNTQSFYSEHKGQPCFPFLHQEKSSISCRLYSTWRTWSSPWNIFHCMFSLYTGYSNFYDRFYHVSSEWQLQMFPINTSYFNFHANFNRWQIALEFIEVNWIQSMNTSSNTNFSETGYQKLLLHLWNKVYQQVLEVHMELKPSLAPLQYLGCYP